MQEIYFEQTSKIRQCQHNWQRETLCGYILMKINSPASVWLQYYITE